jgi:hypothetical protein
MLPLLNKNLWFISLVYSSAVIVRMYATTFFRPGPDLIGYQIYHYHPQWIWILLDLYFDILILMLTVPAAGLSRKIWILRN